MRWKPEDLNDLAARLVGRVTGGGGWLHLRVSVGEVGGATVVDCGAAAPGGLRAGALLARACLADLAEVGLIDGDVDGVATPHVQVMTDHPVAACLGSQYAGWPVSVGKFFAMGSGPMRAARGKEPMLEHIGMTLDEGVGVVKAVGVLECRKPPGPEVVEAIAAECDVLPAELILLFAPTASLAGGVQVVARSVETALHKLHELEFDLGRVVSAHGVAPLPPVAGDDMAAIGRTNDAVLYGGRVVLWVTGDDESLADVGPKVPSSASRDFGAPFAEVFARYNHDFYAVDPMLFSPAQVVLQNVETGRTHAFGATSPGILKRSFFGG
jgi:methenyltetrahydromethanopterin cyclohydrolase